MCRLRARSDLNSNLTTIGQVFDNARDEELIVRARFQRMDIGRMP